MLVQHQIKTYIKNNYLPAVLKQIPINEDITQSLLTLTVKIDLIKTLKQAKDIATFIIGNFIEFHQLVQHSILENFEESGVKASLQRINISFSIHNCSLPRHNIESSQFLTAMFEQNNGILVYLKDCRVLMTHQPELYLSSWTELWENTCKCDRQVEALSRKQRLVEIVKRKAQNLKEAIEKEPPRCELCQAKLKLIKMQDKIYLSCQKIKILTIMKTGASKEQIFQKGELCMFLDQSHVDSLNIGDNVDMCAFFSAEPFVTRISGQDITVSMGRSAYLICHYPPAKRSSINSCFYSSLSRLTCQYIHCPDPRNEDTVAYNFSKLIQTINQIKFPYLSRDTFSTFKLIILNSLFNQLHSRPLHLMIITEEVSIIEKAVRIEGITIYKWPSQYDQSTLVTFLTQCHNAIVLVTNPTKKDFENINNILNENILKNLNCTIWIVGEPNKQYKKDLNLDKIQIVVDLSSEKNFNICRDMFNDLLDQRLDCFVDRNSQLIQTVVKRAVIRDEPEYYQSSFEGVEQSQLEIEEQAKISDKLLEQYFLRAREYKHINTNSLRSINKIASGFAFFRSFLRQQGSMSTKEPLPNILDAILAIFIEEQTSRNKYSSSNTLFSNEISKLMLNEDGCELSLWDYQLGQGNYLQEAKRVVSKETMFKKMVNKLTTLIFENQVL